MHCAAVCHVQDDEETVASLVAAEDISQAYVLTVAVAHDCFKTCMAKRLSAVQYLTAAYPSQSPRVGMPKQYVLSVACWSHTLVKVAKLG